jgi:hypothetical protein
MVYFRTKNSNLGKFWRALHRLQNVDIVYGHLEYFTDIWNILRTFGTFCVTLEHFSGFRIMYQEKSGNPVCHTKTRGDAEKGNLKLCALQTNRCAFRVRNCVTMKSEVPNFRRVEFVSASRVISCVPSDLCT